MAKSFARSLTALSALPLIYTEEIAIAFLLFPWANSDRGFTRPGLIAGVVQLITHTYSTYIHMRVRWQQQLGDMTHDVSCPHCDRWP